MALHVSHMVSVYSSHWFIYSTILASISTAFWIRKIDFWWSKRHNCYSIWKDLYSVSSTSIHIPPVSQLPAHGHLDKLSTKVCFFWATKNLYTNTIYQRHWRSTYWSEIAIKQHKQLQQYYKLKQFQVVSLLMLYINRSFSRLTDLIEYRIIYYIIFDKTCLALIQQPPLENSCCWNDPSKAVQYFRLMMKCIIWSTNGDSHNLKKHHNQRLVSFNGPQWTEKFITIP